MASLGKPTNTGRQTIESFTLVLFRDFEVRPGQAIRSQVSNYQLLRLMLSHGTW